MLLLLIGISWPAISFGQTLDATIRGHLEDSSGARLTHAVVQAINENTLDTRIAMSDEDGQYTLAALAPGTYRIETQIAGFRSYIRSGIQLRVGQNLRLDILLIPGGPDEEVVVTANQLMLEPDTVSLGSVIENSQIVNFPLDGRNFLQLMLLLPGTAPSAPGSPGSIRGAFTVNVSGSREDSNNFILDGAFNNDPKLNSYAINPPVDAIREFEILTSTYDASFGRSGGGQVNMALKSGTNRFHGTAYEFFRNAALDARNFFEKSDDGPARYQRNQFGFSLGGSLKKNQTFFFVDYEGQRIREGITRVTNVPTDMEREGDFSKSIFPRPINPITQLPFENDRIPDEFISETGRAIAALYPLPNRAASGQNYVSSPVLRDRNDGFDIRLDHSFSKNANWVARYSFSDRDLYEPFSGPNFTNIPGFGSNIPRRAQNLLLSEDRTFASHIINQARFSYSRVASAVFHENLGNSLNRSVGLPEISSNPKDFGLSFITVSGFSPLGDDYNNPQHSVTNVFQVADTLTYLKGKHLIRAGFDLRFLQQNAFRNVQSRGFLAFSDYGQTTGNGLADLLLGYLTYSGGARIDNYQHLRTRSLNFFVQDSYRLSRNVTLQLGLRYEYNAPPVDRYDRAYTYDPDSGTLVPVGKDGVPRSVFSPDRNNWGPRVGFAWSPGVTNSTVVHAGYGIYYDQSSLAPGEGLYFNKPFYDLRLFYPLPGFPLTVNDPFPSDYPFEIPASALGFDRNLRTAYFQHWNLTIGRQIGANGLAEIAYVGSAGRKLLSARDINQPAATPIMPNPRPNPGFADILFLESRGNSNYNSLQARFQQRLRAGTTALVSYTFGKSIDETSTFFASAGDANFPQNSAQPQVERGRSNFDLRHRFSLAYSYDLPFGRGRKFLGDRGFISWMSSGWTTYGIITMQSGRPFTVALLPELDNSNTGIASLGFGANDRPDRISSGSLDNPGPDGWFNTGAFVLSDFGTFGNSGRNILEGPGYHDFSLSIMKDTFVRENVRLQFRTEFFNAFNHANFDLPDNFWGSPTFGRINSAQNPRRIQFGLKLIF